MKKVVTPLPIGIENFEDMITQEYYYVDKTLMIKDLIDKGGKVNLFTRPRRFGKTLALSTLQYFFDTTKRNDAHLFDGLYIQSTGNKYSSHQNRYPVIKMTLKGAEGPNFDHALSKFKSIISREVDRHSYLQDSKRLNLEEKAYLKRLYNESGTQKDFESSLIKLSEILYKHHNEKVIFLIDEYDVPLEKAYFAKEGSYYDDMVRFIRAFFGDALKTNDALQFAVITGCLRVSKESIFTGLNNLNIISILSDDYGEYFGFTEPEVKALLTHYELEHKTDEMRDWYNGYLFGETTVYNPWSSIKYLSDVIYGKMEFPVAHWSNTSSNSIVRDLIANANDETKNEIELLIQGETITKPINEDIIYADIMKNMDNLWNFLFFTGYLKKVSKTQIEETIYFELKIPNREIRYIYNRHIREWFDEQVGDIDMNSLYTAVLNQDIITFEDEINEILGETISYMDSHENFYHGFLTGVLRGIKGYIVKSNRESGNGRGDIFLKPRSIRKPAIIIEVKIAKEAKDLEAECDAALKQIEEKKYSDELRAEGYTQIIKYGIAFCRKDCLIKLL